MQLWEEAAPTLEVYLGSLPSSPPGYLGASLYQPPPIYPILSSHPL